MKNIPPLLLIIAACALSLSGCVYNPDSNSGGDGDRHVAKPITLGQPIPDSVSYPDGDRTDWMKFVIEDDALLKIDVNFASIEAGVIVEIRNTFGKLVDKRIKLPNQSKLLSFESYINSGRYFIRVAAMDEGDKTNYILNVNLQ